MAKKPSGFLDLDQDIRFQIYDLLLTPRYTCWESCSDGGDFHYEGYTRRRDRIPITSNAGKHEPLSPETLTISWPEVRKYEHVHEWDWSVTGRTELHPAILSTCKTIAREATLILYGKTEFVFRVHNKSLGRHPVPRRKKTVGRLFDYSAAHDQWPYCTSHALATVEFAAFVRKIGRENASLLTTIRFIGTDAFGFAKNMPTVTELLVQYCGRVRNVAVQLNSAGETLGIYDWSEYRRWNRKTPPWIRGDFEPMFGQFERFVREVKGLRSFKYTGQRQFPDVTDGSEKLMSLEKLMESGDHVTDKVERAKDHED